MICLFSLEFMCRDTFFNSFKNRLILGVPSNNINICIKRYVKYPKSQFNITIVILRRFCYDYKCKIKFRGAKSFDRIFFNGRRTNIYDVFDCLDRRFKRHNFKDKKHYNRHNYKVHKRYFIKIFIQKSRF